MYAFRTFPDNYQLPSRQRQVRTHHLKNNGAVNKTRNVFSKRSDIIKNSHVGDSTPRQY